MSPYIKEEERKESVYNETAGKLAYNLTMQLLDFLDEQRCKDNVKVSNFQQYATAIGVIELTKLELWDRLIRPYEKKKPDG